MYLLGRYWVVVHLQSGESVERGCQIHPAITYEVIVRNRHIAGIWPRGEGRRFPGPKVTPTQN